MYSVYDRYQCMLQYVFIVRKACYELLRGIDDASDNIAEVHDTDGAAATFIFTLYENNFYDGC